MRAPSRPAVRGRTTRADRRSASGRERHAGRLLLLQEAGACQVAEVVGEGLLQQLAVGRLETTTCNLAEVEALLEGEHQRLDGGALAAGMGVLVAVPVCA